MKTIAFWWLLGAALSVVFSEALALSGLLSGDALMAACFLGGMVLGCGGMCIGIARSE